jgi:hypothetical protein
LVQKWIGNCCCLQQMLRFGEESCSPACRRNLLVPPLIARPAPPPESTALSSFFPNSDARRRRRSARTPTSPLAMTHTDVPARLAHVSEPLTHATLLVLPPTARPAVVLHCSPIATSALSCPARQMQSGSTHTLAARAHPPLTPARQMQSR